MTKSRSLPRPNSRWKKSMASSDDEGEPVPNSVSDYYFVDEADEPISLSKLPIQWDQSEKLDCGQKLIFLNGIANCGLQKVYKQVTAWKFKLSGSKPEILVLSKDRNWIKLEKPRKSFKDMIRTIMITVHCLHILRKNPETSKSTLLSCLSKEFSSYPTKPSEDDLARHKLLISEAAGRDKGLVKSKYLGTFLEEQPRLRMSVDEETEHTTMSDDSADKSEDESEDESDLFDSVCAICDNGGELLCCEGGCLRSFHATADAGSDSMCESLGLSDEQVEAIPHFICKNCESKEHQCFCCGKLGSSDKSLGAEVFACVSATCGRFYHPQCVSKLIHLNNGAEAKELQKKIAAGQSFLCPVHECYRCKKGENKLDHDLQFAVCRRCPKSYHKKCLPRKIAFEDIEEEGIMQRAWEDLLPNRALIYCLDHELDDDMGTPARNHIKFPSHKMRKQKTEEASKNTTVVTSATNKGGSSKKRRQISVNTESSKKQKVDNYSKTISTNMNDSTTNEGDEFWDEKLDTYLSRRKGDDAFKHPIPLDDDSKKKILDLMRDVVSSITLEEIVKKQKMPSTHPYSSGNMADKGVSLGKVERSIEALRAALKKLEEERCSPEDAAAVCEPELDQIFKWQNKFEGYLAPFLNGISYTPFGRYFTQAEKLKEIVDMVHWYVQDGDMVVDFCCGANEFSCLMKKTLDETGKMCKYKNYDIIRAKNDFNFEARDWMSVRPTELLSGSQLVIGLNPPLGSNLTLVNKFIEKALEFEPKLLILVVPREAERLDDKVKGAQYDLVWENAKLLSGKPFYLPGSANASDAQVDELNLHPPSLYLWSRSDWTDKHKLIAEQHGHFSLLRSSNDPNSTENFAACTEKEPEIKECNKRKKEKGEAKKGSSDPGHRSDGCGKVSNSNDTEDKYVLEIAHNGMVEAAPFAFAPSLSLPSANHDSVGWLDE